VHEMAIASSDLTDGAGKADSLIFFSTVTRVTHSKESFTWVLTMLPLLG
jgi:hypothetical protein